MASAKAAQTTAARLIRNWPPATKRAVTQTPPPTQTGTSQAPKLAPAARRIPLPASTLRVSTRASALATRASSPCQATGFGSRRLMTATRKRVIHRKNPSICPNQSQSPSNAALMVTDPQLPTAKLARTRSERPNAKPAIDPEPTNFRSSRARDRENVALTSTGTVGSSTSASARERKFCNFTSA